MSETTAGPPAATDPASKAKLRRAVVSAWAGFAVDSYSIFIASSVLLPALVYFQGDATPEQTAIFAGMTLALTLLGRPLGGLIFGHLADRLGRRLIGSITIYGFGTISLLIALLPGADLIGAVPATTLLLFLRFVEGIFLGGEYTAATPMALEHARPEKRGLTGSLIQCAASFGPTVGALAMSITLVFAPSAGPDSAYVVWGWRIPFVLGFILSVLVAWFLRRRVEESAIQTEAVANGTGPTRSPLVTMLRGKSKWAFLQAWVTFTGLFFVVSINGSVLNQFLLGNNQGYTAQDLANTQLLVPLAMLSYIFFGWLSDYIGRKRALYIGAAIQGVCYPIVIVTVGSGTVSGWLNLTILAVLAHALTVIPFGVLPSYINERFSTLVRSSGWGVAYGTAVIIPSFFSYYMIWLGNVMPFIWTAGALTAFGSLLILIATLCGPETRGIDLRKAGTDAEPGDVPAATPRAAAAAAAAVPAPVKEQA
jgi:MFS family permease